MLRTVGGLAAFFGLSGVGSAAPDREPGPKKDEILVGVSPSASDIDSAVESRIPSNAAIVHSNETLGYVAVEFPDASAQAKENFKENVLGGDNIEYAEDNETLETFLEPNDPQYSEQYAPQQVNCEGAWERTLGGSEVTISIVDQGIQYDHPNLEENMDDSVSDFGENFAGPGSDPYPVTVSEDHGTHVGGIAAGETDNEEGHAGISNCSMLSARALDESGGGSLSDIADAIQWSADQGADVINLSLGGGGFSQTLNTACEYAYNEGSLLVAAAGNDGTDTVSYPAAYDAVVAVSSLDSTESRSNFSNYGPEIELAAPGTNVLSTVNWDEYDTFSGTSMASPIVAGVAGLVLSEYPDLSNEELREHLQETAVDIGLPEDEQGYGRVDAANAVTTDPENGGDEPGNGECGGETNTASTEGRLSSGWWGNPSDSYSYELETADPCSATTTLEGPSDADFDLFLTLDGRTPSPGDYDESSSGSSATESITVDLDGDEELGILVERVDGSGTYELEIEERSS
ncbi:Subtilisin-like serine protease [Natrarchaeobaculum sulfurireducens]|nr:Subtilisin-like serine protease [Natrarchaeobaculum sulfurireducens]